LKYCQRFESIYDEISGYHLIVTNNSALDSFMETFCAQFQNVIKDSKQREVMVQNLIINQTVVEVSSSVLGNRKATPSLEMTITLHSVEDFEDSQTKIF
jgi:hypothetical protein